MAGSLAELPEQRKYARWWEWLPAPVRALKGVSLREDRTIRRLGAEEIDLNRDLRTFVESHQIEPEDLLVYMAYAEVTLPRFSPTEQRPIRWCWRSCCQCRGTEPTSTPTIESRPAMVD